MKYEKMNWEILEAIKNEYDDGTEEGKELIRDCMLYLKELNNFKDDSLNEQILDWFEANSYCIDCGCKLQAYEWSEAHTELDGNPLEYFSAEFCPNCDEWECKNYNLKEEN